MNYSNTRLKIYCNKYVIRYEYRLDLPSSCCSTTCSTSAKPGDGPWDGPENRSNSDMIKLTYPMMEQKKVRVLCEPSLGRNVPQSRLFFHRSNLHCPSCFSFLIRIAVFFIWMKKISHIPEFSLPPL